MAASLPAAEACDVEVATESPAKSAIKSTFVIFMFPLLCPVSLVCETRASSIPTDMSLPMYFLS